MSLNNISLPPQLVADLYGRVLVAEAPKPLVADTPKAAAPVTAVPFLGEGKKNILLVVNNPGVPFLPDEELAFLLKILTACGLGLDDVALVNWAIVPVQNAQALLEQFAAKTVLLFDLPPALFGLAQPAPLYTVLQTENRIYVAAPTLRDIEKKLEVKQQFWLALKQLFGL